MALTGGLVRRWVAWAVTLAMIAYVFTTVHFEAVIGRYSLLSWRELTALLALLLINILIGSQRLERLLVYFGNSIRFVEVFRANVAGLTSSLVFINIFGSLVGRHYILRRNGVSVASLTAIVTAERILMVVISACLVGIALIVLFGVGALVAIVNEIALVEVVSAILLTAFVMLVAFRWRHELAVLRQMVSAHWLLRIGVLGLCTLAAQGVMLTAYIVSAQSLSVTEASWFQLAAAAAIVAFAAGLPISVNGWGIREASAIFAFGHLGISAPDATAISILVGLVSTAAIILTTPVLALKSACRAARDPDPAPSDGSKSRERTMVAANTAFLLFAGPLATLLVFVTMHVPFGDTLISLNLADPFAILCLSFVALSWVTMRHQPLRLPQGFAWWIGGLSLLILFGFLHGVARFGITDWALNNRLIGWVVLLGYISLGAMMVTNWGTHGLRRIAEVALTAGGVITLFDLVHREIFGFFDPNIFITSNFEGFSMNRNAFAFQLLISASAGLAYSKVVARTRLSTVYCVLLGAIFMGVWRTHSLTGLITGTCLVSSAVLFRMVDVKIVARSLLWMAFLILLFWLIPWITNALLAIDWTNVAGSAGSTPSLRMPHLYIPSSQVERWMTMQKGLEMWLQNPLFGAGLGAFTDLRLGEKGRIIVIHSVPIWLLAEFGLTGFIVVASLPVALFVKGLRWRLSLLPPHVVFLLAAALCFAVFGLAHDIFYQRIIWLVLGGCAAAWAGRERRITTR